MVKEAVNAIAGALHKVGSYADADQSQLSGTNQTAAAARGRFAEKKLTVLLNFFKFNWQ
ncbi:MAG: hypothetical protein CM1200mP18_10140 [Gammaproteobacteria bacterium]|nr:MAG: hypothetical protein CM1200mP18_10140 [Gammaproteobacteria bacterium]